MNKVVEQQCELPIPPLPPPKDKKDAHAYFSFNYSAHSKVRKK